eukprot:scaffold199204_cov35-Tisochrysis_lutea.AAC.3
MNASCLGAAGGTAGEERRALHGPIALTIVLPVTITAMPLSHRLYHQKTFTSSARPAHNATRQWLATRG